MATFIIFSLIILGLILVAMEVFVVPGTTFVGLTGLVMLVIGLWLAFQRYGGETGAYILIGVCLFLTFSVFAALKAGTWKGMTLSDSLQGRVNVMALHDIEIGDKGVTASELRPSGKAIIRGHRVEVETTGEHMDEDRPIEVIKLKHNKIIVKPVKT